MEEGGIYRIWRIEQRFMFFQLRRLKKRTNHPPEKVPLLLDKNFLVSEMDNSTLNLRRERCVFYLTSDAKQVDFHGINRHLLGHFN
jgi:hypothetical protein